jgi:hypothetical protein
VGNPQRIHYTVNLMTGALIRAWSGNFLEVGGMWNERGNQIAYPQGPVMEQNDSPIAAKLADASAWPDTVLEADFKFLGYDFDQERNPTFRYHIQGLTIADGYVPGVGQSLNRKLTIEGDLKNAWALLAEGKEIVLLEDGSYLVDEQLYVQVVEKPANAKPELVKANGVVRLVLPLSGASATVKTALIW